MLPIHLPATPRRILLVKPSAIGDVVHALPVLNLVRKKWPAAHITWVVAPECAGIIEGHPQLDAIIRFDRKGFSKAWRSARALGSLVSFVQDFRKREFDLVIDLQGLLRSGLMTGLTHAPVRIGLSDAREGAPAFYTHVVNTAPVERHAIERYLCVTEALGCGRGPVEFIFPTTDEDRRAIAAQAPGRYAALFPGTNWPTKRWPAERFAAVVGPLRERFGLASVAAGAPSERELCKQVRADVNLAGRTTLRQLVALIEGAELIIANDSAPMHIAAALGKPLVAPFGPTNPVRTGPYGRMPSVIRLAIICSPCYSRRCVHQSCLQWLEPEPVLALARQQMAAMRT